MQKRLHKKPNQISNNIFYKFIRQESESFYQASLFLHEDKHLLCWELFALWNELNPIHFWWPNAESSGESKQINHDAKPEKPFHLIEYWKEKVFLPVQELEINEFPKERLEKKEIKDKFSIDFPFKINSGISLTDNIQDNTKSNSISNLAWSQLCDDFGVVEKELLLNMLNGFEASVGTIRFPSYRELEVYLKAVGGSIALTTAQLVFDDDIREGSIEFLDSVSLLGQGILWWQLLQRTHKLALEGKLFIPLEDLQVFDCCEKDLLAEHKNNSIVELTKFELGKVIELLKVNRKNTNFPQKGLKDALTLITNSVTEEIQSALRSGWVLSSATLPSHNKSKKSNSWFVSGLTKLSGTKLNATDLNKLEPNNSRPAKGNLLK
ncbi:MAG: squalene/phytoene synthase family protein [Candidatus Melainabacteria bacterium]